MFNTDTTTGFVIGLGVGAVVGIAIGILYAPRPGEETREILMEKAEEIKEKAADAVEARMDLFDHDGDIVNPD